MSASPTTDAVANIDDAESSALSDDALKVPGAPIEKVNPLGQEVTLLLAVMLNIG